MDKIDSALRQELVKRGYDTRSLSAPSIIRTLLRDLDQYQQQAHDRDHLLRQNVEFSQNAMHYKLQLEEKQVELTSIKRAAAEEKKEYEERIDFFQKQIDGFPQSKSLQQIWGTDISKEQLNLLHYADRQLHELQETNKKLMHDLDKQFLQTGVFVTKIKTRDIEIQRLTDLINSGKVKFTGSRSDEVGGYQLKLLQEKNAELERTVERLRTQTSSGAMASSSAVPELDLRKQLELAEAARKELAVKVDCLNSKCTSLQGVIARYKHEVNMVRIERDDCLRQLQEYQSEALAASAMANEHEAAQRRTNSLDENGNDATCRTKEMPIDKENRQKNTDAERQPSRTDGGRGVSSEESENQLVDEQLRNKVIEYEAKFSRLSDNLRMFRDAITKKDDEIANLRSQLALISRSHEENAKLRDEVAHLRGKSRDFKAEICKLRQQIRSYTSEAARAAELAAANEPSREPVGDAASATLTRNGARSGAMPTAPPLMPPVDKHATAGPSGATRSSGTQVTVPITESGAAPPANNEAHTAASTETAVSSAETVAMKDQIALLTRAVAESQARASLEQEKRLQVEMRLQQLEQQRRQQSLRDEREHQPEEEQPPKKFKGTIRIGQINGEIELSPNTFS